MENKKKKIFLKIVFVVLVIIILASIGIVVRNNVKVESENPNITGGDGDNLEDFDGYSPDKNGPGDYKISGEPVPILDRLVTYFDEVDINQTVEDLLSVKGNPIRIDEGDFYSMYVYYIGDDIGFMKFQVQNDNNVIVAKIMAFDTLSQLNAKISDELRTTVVDLTAKEYVHIGMTLDEVKAVLGDGYVQTQSSTYGVYEYTWIDKYENYQSIAFDKEDKVIAVSDSLAIY